MAKKNARVETPVETVETAVVETPTMEATETATSETAPSKRLGLGLCGLPPMRRMDFQDALLEANREMKLDDRRLAILMMVEHPWGCDIPEHYVTGIRRLYNEGKHTKNQVKPATPVPMFNEAGEVITRKPRAKKVAAVEAVAV